MTRRFLYPWLLAASCLLGQPLIALSQNSGSAYPASSSSDHSSLESFLPPSIASTLDINAWAWISYLHNSQHEDSSYWLTDFALGATQRIGDRAAISAEMHFIDDNGVPSGFLEQAFATFELFDRAGTLLTIGKFNASIGAEPRDEWHRLTGTPSLLFGAEPQDLVGVMVTQPLGETGLSFKPFLTSGFEGRSSLTSCPAGGLTLEYKPNHTFDAAITGLVSRGFHSRDEEDEYASEYYGSAAESYDSSYSNEYLFKNWIGPNLDAASGGMLYFLDARVKWMPRPDWTLSAEGMLATSGPSGGELAWAGAMLLANYDITDHWRLFARGSYLNDKQGLITGDAENRFELSGGVGFQILRDLEIRTEYRHDFAPSGGVDTVSVHLTFAY